MFPLVEFCVSNMAKGGDIVYEKLENDPDVDVLEYGCLQIVACALVGCMYLSMVILLKVIRQTIY